MSPARRNGGSQEIFRCVALTTVSLGVGGNGGPIVTKENNKVGMGTMVKVIVHAGYNAVA